MAKSKSKKEKHPLYHSWGWMRKMDRKFEMSKEWKENFYVFVEDMGLRPTPQHQLCRVDKTKGYSKENCIWKEMFASNIEDKKRQKLYRKAYPDRVKNTIIKKTYGITLDEFLLLKEKQNNKCAICNKEEDGRELSIDHCHESKKIRGLLCNSCNNMLGRAKDSVEVLQSAITYLNNNN